MTFDEPLCKTPLCIVVSTKSHCPTATISTVERKRKMKHFEEVLNAVFISRKEL